jgi:peptide/nickel transport system substrate-binding protein
MSKRPLWLSVVALLVGAALLGAAGCGGNGGKRGAATKRAPSGGVAGGTANFNLQSDTDYIDPALAYYSVSWQMEYATCAKLLNYPDRPAPEGSQLQPEVATAMPSVSRDGRRYTFTIRKGYRFSPPSNQTVTARTFKFVIERDLNPKMQSPAVAFLHDVRRVVARGDKLVVTLTKPAPDFPARIAMPFFCAIPTTTPIVPQGVHTVPSAGPYYVAAYTPNRQIKLKRNPNYHGPRVHNLDQMVYTVGVNPNQGLLQIEAGQADYAVDGVPPSANAQLAPKYGPRSPAAKAGKQQYFVNPSLSFRYLGLNTSRPLFRNRALRKAVNYAIDRPAILRQRGAFAGTPYDHYLPPAIRGSSKRHVYPLHGPDLAKARKLAGTGHRGTAVMYTCNASPCPESAAIIQANLKAIGIDVQVKQWARAVQFSKQGTRGEPFDIAFDGWQADYADPYDFLNVLLDGKNIHATNNVNFSYFDDPRYNRALEAAAKLNGPKRYRRYGQLDIAIAKNASPLAAWDVDNDRDFFSTRMGCVIYQPVYTIDLASLCIRRK